MKINEIHRTHKPNIISSNPSPAARGKIKKLLVFFIPFILCGCSAFDFDNDMPLQTPSLKEFKTDLIGNYYFNDSILKLKEDLYYNSKYHDESFRKKDSFSLITINVTITKQNFSYSGAVKTYYNISKIDTFQIINKHKEAQRNIENGFLIITEDFEDTLLNLATEDKLKFYGNRYYMNHYVGEHDWEIYQLDLNKDLILSLNQVNEIDEKQLKNNFIKKNQALGNIVHLSNLQFYAFIKKGGFRTRYKFKKIIETK